MNCQFGRRATLLLLSCLLPSAAVLADGPTLVSPASGSSEVPAAPWHVVGLPQQTKPFTKYSVVTLDGQRVLKVEADKSYGNLVHPVTKDAAGKYQLSWRWRLDEPISASDLRTKDGDDSPVKVCAMYDLPIDAVPFVERQLLKIARSRSEEAVPTATICYVWDAHLAPGTVLDNAFTRRIRFIVLRGPEAPLKTWVTEQRDVRADFLKLFGDEADKVVPLVGVGVGADADNTRSHSLAYIGSIKLD